MTATDTALVIARRVDPRRGLIFEIQSGGYVGGSDLYIRLTADAPASTRRVVLREPLAATCDVAGQHVRESPGSGTIDFTSVAERATKCALFVGTLHTTPDLADFSDEGAR